MCCLRSLLAVVKFVAYKCGCVTCLQVKIRRESTLNSREFSGYVRTVVRRSYWPNSFVGIVYIVAGVK